MKTTHYLQTLIEEDCSKCQALMGKGASTQQLCLSNPTMQLLNLLFFFRACFSHPFLFPAFSYIKHLKKKNSEPVSSLPLRELLHFKDYKHLSQRAE